MTERIPSSRVLVVDDREENLAALRAVLEPLHVPVVEARSGEDALRELLAAEFALILLDVDMPNLNGFETADLVKRHPRTSHIPIIFLTAFDEPLARAAEGYRFGAVDYIAKPCDPFILRAKVRVFLDLHDQGVLLARQAEQLERHVEQLRVSRTALADAQRIANLGSWEYEPSTGRVRGSRQFHEIFGLADDTPLPVATELFARVWLDGGRSRGDALLHTASRANFEGELRRPDGSVRHVVIHVEPRADALTMIGTIQDVTDQREARRALDAVLGALERERELVQLFQSAVAAPALPHAPEAQVSYCYRPAESAVVGGDWYDVLELPGGEILLAIGDVAGHGLAAASAMAEIRTAFRVLSMRESRPAQIVEELNRYVTRARPDVFATMLLLRFDPRTGTCTMSNAGHLPPLELGGAEVTLHTYELDPPLGTALSRSNREVTFTLEPDHTLVLYTDGLVERRGEALDEGLRRLTERVASMRPDDAELADRFVGACAGDDLRDDVAVLSLHHRGARPVMSLTLPADIREVAPLRTTVRRWLHAFGGADDDVEDTVLALCEVVANACIHAYAPGVDGTIRVDGVIEGDDVRLTVADDGKWRPEGGRVGGHGLRMAAAATRELSIDREDGGTTVVISACFKTTRRDESVPSRP